MEKIMKTVNVLMSTYNGERFLREQIDSILAQQNVKVHLIIRDDGSTDSTCKILREYEKNENVQIIYGKTNLGPANAFMTLLYNADLADYYAFADQDDIWLGDKLISTIHKMEREKEDDKNSVDVKLLGVCNQLLIDEKGLVIGKRSIHQQNTKLLSILFGNELSGCSMVINRALREYVIDPIHRPDARLLQLRMHDTWMALTAASVGKICITKEPKILYRQHGANVVGAYKKQGLSRILSYCKTLFSKQRGYRCKTARELLKCMGQDLSQRDQYAIRLLADANTLYGKINLIKHSREFCRDRKSAIIFNAKVILGIL